MMNYELETTIPLDVALLYAKGNILKRILCSGTTEVPQIVIEESSPLHVPESKSLEIVTFDNPGNGVLPTLDEFFAAPLPEPSYVPLNQETPGEEVSSQPETTIFVPTLWYPNQDM